MIFKNQEEYTQSFVVSEEIYNGFLNVFNDYNPLHTQIEFAMEKGFANKVMHGNILNGFLSYFIGECLPIKNVIIHSQEIQYKNAVFLNDVLQFKATVSGIFESVQSVEFKFEFRNMENRIVAKGKIQIGILI